MDFLPDDKNIILFSYILEELYISAPFAIITVSYFKLEGSRAEEFESPLTTSGGFTHSLLIASLIRGNLRHKRVFPSNANGHRRGRLGKRT